MKEHDILKYLLLDINDATPAEFDVRTEGGDEPADPPEVIVSWDATRLPNYNGHTTYVGPIRNSSGDAVGKEYHQYFTFDADMLVRHEDELTRDQILSDLHTYFAPYEADGTQFNPDTANWSLGVAGPRSNSFVEPDWYEAGVPVSFTYVKRAEQTDSSELPGTISNIDVFVNNRDVYVASGDERVIDAGTTRFHRRMTVDGSLVVDGELYVNELIVNDGTVTGDGAIYTVDNAYDEITEITSETIET
jgi:hypothetical protein